MPVPTDKDRLLVHGVLMAVFGRGVIIVGPPGAGKSELALTLLDRGHALIADDAVVLEKRTGVFGSAPDVSRGLLAVRGMGVIDVAKAFGRDRIVPEALIEYCIELSTAVEDRPAELKNNCEPPFEAMGIKLPRLRLSSARPFAHPVMIEAWIRAGGTFAAEELFKRHDEIMLRAEN